MKTKTFVFVTATMLAGAGCSDTTAAGGSEADLIGTWDLVSANGTVPTLTPNFYTFGAGGICKHTSARADLNGAALDNDDCSWTLAGSALTITLGGDTPATTGQVFTLTGTVALPTMTLTVSGITLVVEKR